MSEACGVAGWRVYAWVLMGNHYHLAIETPKPNLLAGMKWLQNGLWGGGGPRLRRAPSGSWRAADYGRNMSDWQADMAELHVDMSD